GNNVAKRIPPGYPGTRPFPYPYVSRLLIKDNILERMNSKTAGDGIALQPGFGPISDVTITGNLIRNHQNAVETTSAPPYDGVTPAVDRVTIAGNGTVWDDAHVAGYMVVADRAADVRITGNMINSVHQNAIFLANVRNAAVDRNTILSYHTGVLVGYASDS